jgi:hypothetical protein
MNIEEIIEELVVCHGAVIAKEHMHYNVSIWDHRVSVQQELELTEGELIDLYNEYFNFDNYTL